LSLNLVNNILAIFAFSQQICLVFFIFDQATEKTAKAIMFSIHTGYEDLSVMSPTGSTEQK